MASKSKQSGSANKYEVHGDNDDRGGGFEVVLKELISRHDDKTIQLLINMREKEACAAERLKQQSEMAKKIEDFHACLERDRREHLARQDEIIARERKEAQERLDKERQEFLARHDQLIARQERERQEERRRQDQERRDALQQQERQQDFFREVIQQLQDEVKVLRHNESVHLISGAPGELDTPGKHRTTASNSPYSMTPLSLMMETPTKPFEDSIGSEVVENFAAGDSGSVDETNNCVENDAVEEEEPTKITKSDQGSVILSDEDLRAKGLISSEETFLLNKSDQVGNKVENAKGNKLPLQKIATNKSRALRDAKEKMKMIAGKQKMIVMLICEEMGNVGQKEFFREPLHCISTWLTCIAPNSLLVNRLINNKPSCRGNLQA